MHSGDEMPGLLILRGIENSPSFADVTAHFTAAGPLPTMTCRRKTQTTGVTVSSKLSMWCPLSLLFERLPSVVPREL